MNCVHRALGRNIICRPLLTLARTIQNPHSYHAHRPTAFSPKSVVLLATPTHLQSTIDSAIELYEKQKLQVLVAGVDTVPVGGERGVSELWMDEYFCVKSATVVEDKDDLNKPPRQSDGVNVVGARKNWKLIESSLRMNLAKNVDVSVTLANTAFVNDNLVTLFYLQPHRLGNHDPDFSDRALADLDIELPTVSEAAKTKIHDRWTPLESKEPLFVTNCIGNLIKGLNNHSAAKFLESNKKLMDIGSKETTVYVKVYRDDEVYRYQVIAGGGGWGPKADTLVISPEAKVKKGDKIEFFMVTPEDIKVNSAANIEPKSNAFVFEVIKAERGFPVSSDTPEQIIPTFGCGSEVAFHVNGVLHLSPNETVEITCFE